MNLLQKFREESNKYACLTYDTRMNNIKNKMINRNASQEQFDEFKKIESIYFKMCNCDNDEKINKK